jgi:hypothetical protein
MFSAAATIVTANRIAVSFFLPHCPQSYHAIAVACQWPLLRAVTDVTRAGAASCRFPVSTMRTTRAAFAAGRHPSARVDGAGKVYVVWGDCRFRSGCSSNDIVMSTSTSGTKRSKVIRIPIDSTKSTADHFIPGLGVDRYFRQESPSRHDLLLLSGFAVQQFLQARGRLYGFAGWWKHLDRWEKSGRPDAVELDRSFRQRTDGRRLHGGSTFRTVSRSEFSQWQRPRVANSIRPCTRRTRLLWYCPRRRD